jgi:hypothetical protein
MRWVNNNNKLEIEEMNVFKKRNQHPILVNIAKEFKEKAPAE